MTLADWKNLPDLSDPRAPEGARRDVVLREQTWRKVARKHICNPKQPWAEWLTEEGVSRVHDLLEADAIAPLDAAGKDTAAVMEPAIRDGFVQPLAVLFTDWHVRTPGQERDI